MWCPVEHLTAEGYDMQFGTNVLEQMTSSRSCSCPHSPPSRSSDGHARVINTISGGAY
ncbi:uncharacterized protein PHACADRAFT_260928 [Phanerochaete carnosa HHB-10118-sp]|uniref:Uncharacterized protein n=1 Tax=Phanerochaete carnosa (strain HHB-10118-sp) TaxID=650164 RepID=K5VM22_PHACS|nr:uncharacterized protein PHACADRAFT_260928 [Phanerochaete carnosa HHB-10118-sp]EKM52483.1 hypothetical protein PHACADRAFT_260928 [Phanerochaete carnosa HHB-10118-sp]